MRVGFAVILAALAVPAVAPAGTVFLLDGRGWGHGVGMSQWGAEGYARHGFGYRQILAHYYPQTTIEAGNPRPVRVLLARGTRRGPDRVGRAVRRSRRARPQAASAGAVGRHQPEVHAPAQEAAAAASLPAGGAAAAGRLRGVPRRRGRQAQARRADGRQPAAARPLPARRRPVGGAEGLARGDVRGAGCRRPLLHARDAASRARTSTSTPDTRSQMYGGVSAERPQTNLAIGATAGEVLTLGRPDDRRLLLLDLGRAHLVRPRRLAEARIRCRTSSRWPIRTTTSRRTTSGRPRC